MLLIFFSSKFLPEFTGSRWVPSGRKHVKKMLDMAGIKPREKVYDLGSGDGRIVIEAARRKALSIGVEIDPLKCVLTWLRIKKNGLSNDKIRWESFFRTDLRDADVVVLYLLPETLQKLENKLSKLKKGCRVVTHVFKLKGLRPLKSMEKDKIYLYKIR